MILYCCCLDVDDDTDSHASCSRSCFGSFIFDMNISSRDRRINGVVADLRGVAKANGCYLEFDCTARSIIKFKDIAMTMLLEACDVVIVRNDGVHYQEDLPFGVQAGVINIMQSAPVPFTDVELPF